MSQIHKAGDPSVGKPSIRIKWEEFVQLVLELTIRAYRNMRQEKKAHSDWKEDTFTINLESHLRPIALENSIFVKRFEPVITDDMRNGKQSVKEANKIDLSLFWPWSNYDEKHFVWEAKRVGDKRVVPGYSGLNSEYVNEAIYRFIQLKYAIGLSNAGILGYVLAGKPDVIIKDINQTMGRIRKKDALPPSNHLKIADPIGDFQHIYQSHHTKIDSTDITLHHLFLCFDFAD